MSELTYLFLLDSYKFCVCVWLVCETYILYIYFMFYYNTINIECHFLSNLISNILHLIICTYKHLVPDWNILKNRLFSLLFSSGCLPHEVGWSNWGSNSPTWWPPLWVSAAINTHATMPKPSQATVDSPYWGLRDARMSLTTIVNCRREVSRL